MAATATYRFQIRKGRGHWDVVDTHEHTTVMTGLTQPGALQVADHLNRTR